MVPSMVWQCEMGDGSEKELLIEAEAIQHFVD
jgi:hypothetical protein